jgi:hypothetical protein
MTMKKTLLAALLLAIPTLAQAQEELHPTLVDLPAEIMTVVGRVFRSNRNEKLWCVTEYTTTEETGYSLLHVAKIREDTTSGRPSSTGDTSARCLGPDGKPQPTLHTHPSGTCQASPGDYFTIMNRGAAFDGIVCGEKAVVWYFSDMLMDASLYAKYCKKP